MNGGVIPFEAESFDFTPFGTAIMKARKSRNISRAKLAEALDMR